MSRILLTGATGVVGRALLEKLDMPALLLLRNAKALAQELKGRPHIETAAYDLEDITPQTAHIIADFKPDIVIHTAWMGVENDTRDFAPFVAFNLRSCLRLFEAAAPTCRHWVGFGSQAEYNSGIDEPIRETAPTLPTGNYGIAKLAACHMLDALCRQQNIAFSWLRLFPCYSKHLRATYVLPYLIKTMRAGELPELRTPKAQWDYLHADDAARAIFTLAKKPQAADIYNLGHGQPVSVAHIAMTLAQLLDYPRTAELEAHIAANKTAATRRVSDPARLCQALGWKPQIDLRQGLKLCL